MINPGFAAPRQTLIQGPSSLVRVKNPNAPAATRAIDGRPVGLWSNWTTHDLGLTIQLEGGGTSQTAAMPALAFLAVAGLALIALLFVANETLEPGSPPIVSSGLPEVRRPDVAQTSSAATAPAPDMTSQAVLAAQPKSAPDALAKIGSAARAARAEVPRKDKLVTQTLNYQVTPLLDRFSIKGY
jgi:hypothetical protein